MKDLESDFIIGFIGFGLIGGSIARALKGLNKNYTLYAYDYHIGKPSEDLEAALEDGILNGITFSLAEKLPECDIIFLCAPVLSNIRYLQELKSIIKSTCILTDVGSVKSNIHEVVSQLNLNHHFIGGHPMTGSEKTGYANSYSLLLENAYYILTPTEQTPQFMVDVLYHLVKKIGSIPIFLDPYEHDEITAAISHVPHIIAAGLVNLVRESDSQADTMKELAAGGFRDITRIASSSPIMWQNICLTNANSIKRLLDRYINSLIEVSDSLTHMDGDFLFQLFDTASEYRNSLPKKSIGLMKPIFEVYLDIADETGSIATIATMLATQQISMKNIGIIHNREFEEGVLRIEFYDGEARLNAHTLLMKHNYNIYNR